MLEINLTDQSIIDKFNPKIDLKKTKKINYQADSNITMPTRIEKNNQKIKSEIGQLQKVNSKIMKEEHKPSKITKIEAKISRKEDARTSLNIINNPDSGNASNMNRVSNVTRINYEDGNSNVDLMKDKKLISDDSLIPYIPINNNSNSVSSVTGMISESQIYNPSFHLAPSLNQPSFNSSLASNISGEKFSFGKE